MAPSQSTVDIWANIFGSYKFVTGHAKRQQCNHKTTEKMNGNANASAKPNELQHTAQAGTVAAHLLLPNRKTEQFNDRQNLELHGD